MIKRFACLYTFITIFSFSYGRQNDSIFKTQPQDTIPKLVLKDTLSFIGVGDIMLGTNFPDPKYLAPDSGRNLLTPVKHILQNADITFGNHEGVLLDTGGIPKKCNNPDLCYLFRSPIKYVQNLVDAGFDVMSIANNHMGDFGDEGRLSTIKTLTDAGIHNAGLIIKPYTIFEYNGLKIGMAGFSPNNNVMDFKNIRGAKRIVEHLDSICDIVIVSFHGGAEGKKYQHITKKDEEFYGENRGNPYKFSHEMIDAGADIIFGHGPHVMRALELYKDKFIAYSLGNFATYARFNLKDENGIAPIIKVFTDRKGNFIKGEIFPIAQLGEGGPTLDPQKKAIIKLRELTKSDIPETPIEITDDGQIKRTR